jgi:hypothetical protein
MILQTLRRGMDELKRTLVISQACPTCPSIRTLRMSRWHQSRIAGTLGSAIIAVLMIVWIAGLFTTNAECQRTAAAMVIKHLRVNRDQWPKSWDDLRDDFEDAARQRNFQLTFEQLKRRVGVVWDTDVESLRTAERGSEGEPPFQVIWALDNSSTMETWGNEEPNQMIWDHLHQ